MSSVKTFHESMTGGEFFDVIISLAFIEHFSNPAEVLRLMGILLRPDGLGLVFTILPGSYSDFRDSLIGRYGINTK